MVAAAAESLKSLKNSSCIILWRELVAVESLLLCGRKCALMNEFHGGRKRRLPGGKVYWQWFVAGEEQGARVALESNEP